MSDKDNKPEEEKSKLDEETVKKAVTQFFGALNNLKKLSVSQKGFSRALDYALNLNLTDRTKKISLRTDSEKKAAMLIGIALDARMIMAAWAAKNFDKEEENRKETQNEQSKEKVF